METSEGPSEMASVGSSGWPGVEPSGGPSEEPSVVACGGPAVGPNKEGDIMNTAEINEWRQARSRVPVHARTQVVPQVWWQVWDPVANQLWTQVRAHMCAQLWETP